MPLAPPNRFQVTKGTKEGRKWGKGRRRHSGAHRSPLAWHLPRDSGTILTVGNTSGLNLNQFHININLYNTFFISNTNLNLYHTFLNSNTSPDTWLRLFKLESAERTLLRPVSECLYESLVAGGLGRYIAPS